MSKKIISVFLTLTIASVMITISSLSITVCAVQPEEKVINDLQTFHIIEEDDDIRADELITRAEVVKMLCIANGSYEIDHVAPIEYFSDVTKDHWAVKYVAVACQEDVIHGYDDNTFLPEGNVTYQDLQKMIVCTLGYNVYAQNMGGYPSGYLLYSNHLGVTADLTFDNNAYATRGDAMQMIYNALDAPLLVLLQTNIEEDGTRTPIYEMRDGGNYPFESLRMILNGVATPE